jgi:hypothetical protein
LPSKSLLFSSSFRSWLPKNRRVSFHHADNPGSKVCVCVFSSSCLFSALCSLLDASGCFCLAEGTRDVTRIHHERFHENVLNEHKTRECRVFVYISGKIEKEKRYGRRRRRRRRGGGRLVMVDTLEGWEKRRSIFRTQATVIGPCRWTIHLLFFILFSALLFSTYFLVERKIRKSLTVLFFLFRRVT